MLSGISLVAILLALNFNASRAMDLPSVRTTKLAQEVTSQDKQELRHVTTDLVEDEDELRMLKDVHDDLKIAVEERDRPRLRKRRTGHTMLALLMAYKLKFMALIPTLIGGLILLKGTTLLAGFFFSLFAAVLGLKMH